MQVRNYWFPDLVVSLEVCILCLSCWQDPVERNECHSLHSESISSEVYVETVTHISADITEVSSVVLQSHWVITLLAESKKSSQKIKNTEGRIR